MPQNRSRAINEFPFFILPVILLAGLIVMFLWNAIMPDAIHAARINYWQSLGLLILCRILFGGFRGRPGGGRPEMWRGRGAQWREKWKHMSDEDRMKFREQWKRRCGKPTERNDNE